LQYKDADSDVCQDSFGSLANDWKYLLLSRKNGNITHTVSTEQTSDDFITQREQTKLKKITDQERWFVYYSHPWSEDKTDETKLSRLSRYITFSEIDHVSSPELYSGKLYKVEVKGLYIKWWYTWEVLLESFIWDIEGE
jgi:hypothetical protein